MTPEQNILRLAEYLAPLKSAGLCVAFSGGVDSAVILKVACQAGGRVHAVTAQTLFHSPLEPHEAEQMAVEYGAHFHLLTPELPDEVLQNPPNRCYLCKHALFAGLLDRARTQGLSHVLDGTNADDMDQYRPGLRALRELGVHSPLAELGIRKPAVREMAAALGLQVASKPSAPCLATRYPYNQPVVPAQLPGIDRVETLVRSLGIPVVRARVEGETLRLEVLPEQFSTLLTCREQIVQEALSAGFVSVSLDLEGFRSGSMDIRAQRMGILQEN